MSAALAAKPGYLDLINSALGNRPSEVRARVLDILHQLGIDGQDEFWLLFIAFGQLQVLIEVCRCIGCF